MRPRDGSARRLPRPATVVPEHMAATEAAEVLGEAMHHDHVPAMLLSLTVAGLGILLAFATYYWKRISADAFAMRSRTGAPVPGE